MQYNTNSTRAHARSYYGLARSATGIMYRLCYSILTWFSGVVIKMSDLRVATGGRGFESRSRHCRLFFLGYLAVYLGDVTTTQVKSALHPFEVAKSSTSYGWGKGGKVTSAGWQVTLCDPI